MSCLYASDYGEVEPSFDPLADGGRLIAGHEQHAALLARAQNPGQLAAMHRALDRGESMRWCDQGYSWVSQPAVEWMVWLAILGLAAPYLLWRHGAPICRRFALHRTRVRSRELT
jgi:hypothetical protein